MRLRQGRVNRWVLVALAGLSTLLFWVSTRATRLVRTRQYSEKLAAVEKSRQAFELVRRERETRGIPVDSVNDPNGTGLVGVQYSQTTYGRSDLSDALTATNPNFSAAVVELLRRAGVRRGDTVGVSWDGSYPALNIQVLAACHAMGVLPLMATAMSAGMWGANYPGMSWVDIERLLRGAGCWQYQTCLATLGGETDNGRGLSPEGRALLLSAAESAGVSVFAPESLSQGVDWRAELFRSVKALVSVGRAMADIGGPTARVPSRLLAERWRRTSYSGLVGAMRERGVPVIYIGNPSQVAIDNHLPVAPVPLPEPGKGRLFVERRYSTVVAGVFALFLLLLLVVVVRYDVESYIGARPENGDKEAV